MVQLFLFNYAPGSDVAGARAALRKACPKIDAFFSRDKDIDVGSLWNACELWMPHRHSTFANDLLIEPEEDAGSEQVLTFQATRAIRRCGIRLLVCLFFAV